MFTHKQGTSFQQTLFIPASYADGFFENWQVQSRFLRQDTGVELSVATCDWVNPTTTRELVITVLDTATWPVGQTVIFDVVFTRTADNFKISTTTAEFKVVERVT